MLPEINNLYKSWSSKLAGNSPACTHQWSGGILEFTSEKNLTSAVPENENIFQITGEVEILDLYAVVKSVTDATTFSDIYFDLYDGTNSVDVTDSTTGGVASGATVGSIIAKAGPSANTVNVSLSTQVRLIENSSFNKPDVGFIAVQKASTNSYIRFGYTGDATTDVTVKFYCRWMPKTDDGNLVAV